MKTNITIGSGTLNTLQIVFIVLKLCKLIDWSWWAVLIPLWVELGFIVLFIVIGLIIHLISRS